MSTTLTPFDRSEATRTGPRMFRKQVLRKATIHYPTADGKRKAITFDDAYLDQLEASFKAGAYDDVPFVLADEKNRHTMAPERFHGWIKGVERTPDGLDALIELSQEAADLVARTGNKLGVSARIRPVEHVDGRSFPLAINHVLGTLDGRMQGPEHRLTPWQPVDLSDPSDDDVLDLSGATYQEGTTMPRMLDLSLLSDEDADALASFAALNGIALSAAEPDDDDEPYVDPADDDPAEGAGDDDDEGGDEDGEGDDSDAGEVTDDELNALIEAELADMGVELSLSSGDDTADPHAGTTFDLDAALAAPDVDLAAAEHAGAADDATVQRRENATLRAQLAARDYVAAGVPPHVVDLARPVLALADDDLEALDLSNPTTDTPLDPRAVVRSMLDSLKGTVDLSREEGYGHETEPGDREDATAAAWIDHLENN